MLSAFILYLAGSLCDAFAIDLAMLFAGRVMEALVCVLSFVRKEPCDG